MEEKKKEDAPVVRGYKVFDRDWKCRGFQYEVGKVFRLEEGRKLEMCGCGFHFCRKAADCFNYQAFSPENKCAEVEAVGEVIEDGDKCVTDAIRIVREVGWHEMLELCNTGHGNTGLRNSGYRNSGDRNSGNWNSGNWNSGDRNSGDRNSGDRNSGDRNSGDRNSGNWNSGNWNSGDRNSGDWNSGYRNSGYLNSGDRNSGDRNSGNWNSGDRNSGNWNSGYRNSGYRNSGDRNSGNWNSGNWNSGNWNSGDRNSGYLNSGRPKVRIFNNETDVDWDELVFPDFFYNVDCCQWICEDNMTEREKAEHEECKTTGGYLREVEYKQAWREAFNAAKAGDDWEREREKLLALPNFDFGIFEEITGITEQDIMGAPCGAEDKDK